MSATLTGALAQSLDLAQTDLIERTWADKTAQSDMPALFIDVFFDARALACPMPLLKAKLNLRTMTAGQSLYLLTADKNSQTDLVAFCQKNNHQIQTWVSQDTQNPATIYCFLITKSAQKN